ncbi:MAG: hypothetical protein ACJ8F2_03535, partial [Xanthobacteraceae bacterium]
MSRRWLVDEQIARVGDRRPNPKIVAADAGQSMVFARGFTKEGLGITVPRMTGARLFAEMMQGYEV